MGEVFSHNGKEYQKAEEKNILVFQPHNANEGPERYAKRNAINTKSGQYAAYFSDHDAVEPLQTTMF